jgi:hypothetical protein
MTLDAKYTVIIGSTPGEEKKLLAEGKKGGYRGIGGGLG